MGPAKSVLCSDFRTLHLPETQKLGFGVEEANYRGGSPRMRIAPNADRPEESPRSFSLSAARSYFALGNNHRTGGCRSGSGCVYGGSPKAENEARFFFFRGQVGCWVSGQSQAPCARPLGSARALSALLLMCRQPESGRRKKGFAEKRASQN